MAEINLIGVIHEKYKSIKEIEFTGHFEKTQELLGDPRYLVVVTDEDVCRVLKEIHKIDQKDEVWKAITISPVKLWAKSILGKKHGAETFKITDIKVLRDLNWVKPKKALFNITLTAI